MGERKFKVICSKEREDWGKIRKGFGVDEMIRVYWAGTRVTA
jgi:hypothetical protein